MAGLLFNRFFIVLCAMVVFCHSAHSYESSFPFPFEFGHSSDIYLKTNTTTKDSNLKLQEANEALVQKGYSKDPVKVLKYIKQGNIEAVKLALDAGFSPNTPIFGSYPIYFATRYKQPEILKLLFERGAKQGLEINSLLREAILNNDSESAKTVIENGADVNFYEGLLDEYVLYTALKKKEYEVAKLMLQKGAKIDIKSYKKIKKNKLEETLGVSLE